MKTLRVSFLAFVCAVGLTACPQTNVPRNFGAKPLTLDSAEWNGQWKDAADDETLLFSVKNAADGQLTIQNSNQEKEKEPPITAFIRDAGSTKDNGPLAFMLTFPSDADQRGSLNLITMPEKGSFHLWNLKHQAVEDAVRRGELKGEVKSVKEKGDEKPHNHTALVADPANYPKLLDSKFWEWTKPSTIVRKAAR